MADPADRCGNTIHSDYVSDHRCRRERGHPGDCLFGAALGVWPGRAVADRPEIEEARRIAEGWQREFDARAPATPLEEDLQQATEIILDLLGKQSEREKALRDALEGVDERFEAIQDAKGTWEERIERMVQEAYFGQKEVVRALAAPLPEQSEEEACPAGNGDDCCGYPELCRKVLADAD
jgi:hypothetical protein